MSITREGEPSRFVVEIPTTAGKVLEAYASYEEARRRVDLFPAESLAGLPLIYEELPDGSERVVRDDGKPLQWHRLPWDQPEGLVPAAPAEAACEVPAPADDEDEPLPLADVPAEFQYRAVERRTRPEPFGDEQPDGGVGDAAGGTP